MKKTKSSSVVNEITDTANDVYSRIKKKKAPELKMPLRALTNVKYDPKEGFFELLGKMKERTLTASTIKTFAQTLRMMAHAKGIIKDDDITTKREMYYISKNWAEAAFKEQPESDTVMDDLEAMMMVNREQLGFIPEEKGGEVAGKLIVIDKDPETGELIRSVELPAGPENAVAAYDKISKIDGDIAILSVAVVMVMADGRCSYLRIAVGGCGPTPFRSPQAEEELIGSELSGTDLDIAADLTVAASDPMNDVRATADYRRRVLPGVVRRALGFARQLTEDE